MSLLCKKRRELGLEEVVDAFPENPPHLNEIKARLLQNGFKPITDQDYDNEYNINEIFIEVSGDARPFVKVSILGKELIGLLDSGAQRTVLGVGSMKIVRELKLKIYPSNTNIKTASGALVEIKGYVNLPVTFNNECHIIPTLIAPNLNRRLILGYEDFWKVFKLKPTVLQSAELSELSAVVGKENDELSESQKQILEEVKGLFKGSVEGEVLDTTLLISHKIEIKDEFTNTPPIRINPYPTSPEIQSKINKELDKMITQGVIEKAKSDWALSTVPVVKPTGEIRLCLDARRLNERTKRDAYPLPHQDRILSRLGSCKYLSTIDLTKAFLQIPLDPVSRRYTAFSILGRGLFQFTRLPFGLVNSPATLARLMDEVLGYGELEPGVFVYLDDIVVVSETFEAHIQSLREVAERLKRANLSVNMEKSKFCLTELPYLGYMLSTDGLRPNPERIEAIINYERPNSIRSLRRFLGMANYYRRFIPLFSEYTAPLTNLLRNKAKSIRWNDMAEEAFSKIKECLITAPVLSNPNFDLPFVIQSDASDCAIAAVLTQEQKEGEKIIAYFSQKLSPAQQSYAASEKEGLAVLSAIEKFRAYIDGTHFTVVTDASALTHIMKGKWRTSSRLSRWSIQLQGYDMEIRHRRGRDNIIPDALSRAVDAFVVEDAWYSTLLKQVESNPDDHLDFKIENGKLFKYVPSKTESLDYVFEWKLCVPEGSRESILRAEHNSAFHIGYDKLLDIMRRRYFWPRMALTIRKFIEKCETCKECKPSNVSQHPPMGMQRISTKPFQILAIDFIQSLPRSKAGNCHLLVLMDLFSKWTLLLPVKKISSSIITKLLEEHWFRRYSVPEILITDNASSFLSNEFKTFLERHGVVHWANARHHSQANPVERLNRTINSCIRTYVKSDQRTWDTKISEVEHTLNNTLHTSTGFSPYRILFGHEIVSRGDQHRVDVVTRELSDNERHGQKLNIDKTVHDLVIKNLKKAHDRSTKSYNLRFQKPAPTYKVGQKVYRRSFALSSAVDNFNSKLGPAYIPCKIISKRGTSSYELEDETGKNLGIFSAADLKPGIPDVL